MSKLNVHLVTLPPFRALCFNGVGPSPEAVPYTKAEEWVKAHGATLQDGTPRRYFGYDNPKPSLGSPNYGYDAWVTIDADTEAEPEARNIDFPGGRYAVARVEAGPQGEGIGET